MSPRLTRWARTAGWAFAAVLVAGWLALTEVFWLPLRVGRVLLPVSILAAVVGNLLLPALARRLSGSRLVAVLPAAVWMTIALAATMRRPEGDLVLVGGGAAGTVNLAFLLMGTVTAVIGAARALVTRPRSLPSR
jgi:hypothetical protein